MVVFCPSVILVKNFVFVVGFQIRRVQKSTIKFGVSWCGRILFLECQLMLLYCIAMHEREKSIEQHTGC